MSVWRMRGAAELLDGVYERVLDESTSQRLATLDERSRVVRKEELDASLSPTLLARAIHDAALIAFDSLKGKDAVTRQVTLANELLAALERSAPKAFRAGEANLVPDLLLALGSKSRFAAELKAPARPASTLSRSELLVNAADRSVISELLSEIDSADEIDLLCSFIKWSGFVKFRDALRRHCELGRPLRVLTTTYMGATDARAIRELHEMGAQVKVSYDDATTRLHAKAWLFRRHSGFETAYVGSSNLSRAAMTDGLEWNVRVTAVDAPQIVAKFSSVFESYWDDEGSSFERYDAPSHTRLTGALEAARGGGTGDDALPFTLEVQARGYQQDMLEQLEAARAHGRIRNLVVAATGTGKTVVAALDYRRLKQAGQVDSLLFVAHREEILRQSRSLFRHVLRQSTFGELLTGTQKPGAATHLFASIQTLKNVLANDPFAADAYDMVIVDEVHHAAADTYRALLSHVKPKVLLGLTATPERADGLRLDEHFDTPYAAELRVWDAINRQILVPFNYFALEGQDLSDVKWTRGRYDRGSLSSKVMGAAHVWVGKVVNAIHEYVADPKTMRALAFCVDVAHATFVAERLRATGLAAEALTSDSDDAVRRTAIDRLRSTGSDRLQVLCTVDLFNEGVDIPEVDTVLFLRPTESATVFLQQLGRGLRRTEGKDALTVLDFIGRQYERFRFDVRYRALLGVGRAQLERQLKEHAFGSLPAGCSLQLDEVARQEVLRSLRQAIPGTHQALISHLRSLGADCTLEQFLEDAGLELADLYEAKRSWHGLREGAGFAVRSPVDAIEIEALGQVQKLIHADDDLRLDAWGRLCREPLAPATEAHRRLARMLFAVVYGLKAATRWEETLRLWLTHHALRAEVLTLVEVLRRRSRLVPRPLPLHDDIPLVGHARYLRDELVVAFDLRSKEGALYAPQTGLFLVQATRHEPLLVTLDKSTKAHMPHLQYEDYALSPLEFHWQSQAGTRIDSEQGRRHTQLEDRDGPVTPVLFVRDRSKDDRGLGMAYQYLGPVKPLRWEGERPISIVWQLEHPMPAQLVREARVAVG